MSGPLIPYIKIPEIPLGLPTPLDSIKPFGVLVATGVYLGTIVATRHAAQRRLDADKMSRFIFHVVGLGFVGAHWFDALFYTPERLSDPFYLLKFWAGLSSYGGFTGAILGALLFRYRFKEPVLPLVDTVCSAFPLAWVFGRSGCASVHDHPGSETSSWLGMQYFHPGVHDRSQWGLLFDPAQTVGRFDLGFIEMVLTIPLATAFAILWIKKPRAYGFYAGWQCVLYAPVRFVLDFFRIRDGGAHEADPRHLGLTPAQWACFGLVALGFYILHLSKRYPAPASWEALRAQHREEDERLLEAERLEAGRLEAGGADTEAADNERPKKKERARRRELNKHVPKREGKKDKAPSEEVGSKGGSSTKPERSDAPSTPPEKASADDREDTPDGEA